MYSPALYSAKSVLKLCIKPCLANSALLVLDSLISWKDDHNTQFNRKC